MNYYIKFLLLIGIVNSNSAAFKQLLNGANSHKNKFFGVIGLIATIKLYTYGSKYLEKVNKENKEKTRFANEILKSAKNNSMLSEYLAYSKQDQLIQNTENIDTIINISQNFRSINCEYKEFAKAYFTFDELKKINCLNISNEGIFIDTFKSKIKSYCDFCENYSRSKSDNTFFYFYIFNGIYKEYKLFLQNLESLLLENDNSTLNPLKLRFFMDAFDVIINNLVKLTLKRGIINKDNLSWGFSIGTYYNNKFIFHKKSRDSICFSDFFTHPQEKDTDLYYEAKKSFNKMLQESEALKNQLKENNFSLKTDISSLKSGESPFTTEPRLLKKEDYAILEKNFKAFFNQLVGNICSIYIKKFNEQ